MSKKILIFGKSGQVATELRNVNWGDISVTQCGRETMDLSKAAPEDIENAILQTQADLVINASAYTAVDLAESEQEAAYALNREAPKNIASACAKKDIPFFHISTDYVFDGSSETPYAETDPSNPQGVYGQSKWEGEEAIRAACPQHIILRTAWVYSPYGGNFVKTMLRLAGEGRDISVVDDQIGCPTSARSIAQALAEMTKLSLSGKKAWGTYHFCGDTVLSWHAFAAEIFKISSEIGLSEAKSLNPIPSSAYPTPAKRPAYSVLDMARIQDKFGIFAPALEDELRASLLTIAEESKTPTKP